MATERAQDVGGDTADELLDWLRLLVDAAAVTRRERALADELERRLGATHTVHRTGDSLVVGTPTGARPCVALVGHLDVVPPTQVDLPLRIATTPDGDVAYGRGTSDMHSGNAVALSLFEELATAPDRPFDLVLVLYAREEGPADENELADVLVATPWLADVDLAIVLEPTDGQLQLGCLGGLHAELRFTGTQAHSARPWHGRNALTAAGPLLAALDALEPVPVEVDGIGYHDVWSATTAGTDNARNVIPGTFVVNLNLRFAPSRDAEAAEAELRARVAELAGPLDDGVTLEVRVVDVAPPAPPRASDALVQQLLAVTGAEVAGKQAWTDLARFAALDVPAVNYGPGLTAQAHQQAERVPVAAMVELRERLARFLTAPAT